MLRTVAGTYRTASSPVSRTTTFDYDANGNLTSKEVKEGQTTQESTTYGWDSENRLVQVVVDTDPIGQDNTGDRVVRLVYCPACRGNLSQKLVWEGSTSMDTTPTRWLRYEQDGLNELRVDERYDDETNGVDETDPWRTLSYTAHGPGQISHEVKTEVFYYADNTEHPDDEYPFYYHFDRMGNLLAITGEDGQVPVVPIAEVEVEEIYTCDAFGVDQSGWSQDNYTTRRITGKRYDADVGLYFFHARWYDPEVGRFIAADPALIGLDYLFVSSSPTLAVDASGLRTTCTEDEIKEVLDGLRKALRNAVAKENANPVFFFGDSHRPAGCTTWSVILLNAGFTYIQDTKAPDLSKPCWEGEIISGYRMGTGGSNHYPSDPEKTKGSRHQATEWKPNCTGKEKWGDPDNVVFDAWVWGYTAFSHKGRLREYTVARFRTNYPIPSDDR